MLVEELKKRGFRYKFRSHYPIGPFVADFYCPELRLVIILINEIEDGETEQEVWLLSHGYTLLHFTHHEISENQERVADKLFHTCLHLSLPA